MFLKILKLEADNENEGYLQKTIWAAIFLAVVLYFFPAVLPFEVFSFWNIKGSLDEWLYVALPWFIWAAFSTSVISAVNYRISGWVDKLLGLGIPGGFLISLWAGVVEEICFRWILFLDAIVTIKVFNYIFFGWMGFGLFEWFQVSVSGPIANFFNFGFLPLLTPYLTDPVNWLIGAAIISSNSLFRDGHKYQGLLGVLNSWFFGMFMFYILFKYGLIVCILIHFTYDLLIFTLVTIFHHLARKFG